MLESLTTAAALALAKVAFDKFVESGAGELGKKLTDGATKSLMALGSVLWDKVKGNERAVAVLEGAAEQKPEAEQQLKKYLSAFLKDEQSDFAQEVRRLAGDLHFELTQIEDNSSMTMNLSGNAKGWQNKISGGTVHQAESITINHNQGPTED